MATLKISNSASENDCHQYDINHLLFHNGKLFTAGDDGIIKIWSSDLHFLDEIKAHNCSVYCLTASGTTLYSCSNDGTVKSWNLETNKLIKTIMEDEQDEFFKVAFVDGYLYVGDEKGFIRVFKDDKEYGFINISESVKDMIVSDHLVFTVKDLDMVVTELKLEGAKIQYGTKKTIMGRAPITLVGDNICFSSRDGRDLIVCANSLDQQFKQVVQIKEAHNLIINAVVGDESNVIYSGGWDKILKKWRIVDGCAKPEGAIELDFVINALTVGENGCIFVGGANGRLVKIAQ